MPDYDQLHVLWARAHSAGSPTKYVRDAVVYSELARLTPGDTLDAGCGTGDYSLFLSRLGHKVTAFDPSPLALDVLRTRIAGHDDIEIRLGALDDFQSDAVFDNVISIEVLEHIKNDLAAVKRLYSFLRPGGCLLISVPSNPFLYSKADNLSGHWRRYDFSRLRGILTSGGFHSIRVRRYGFPIIFLYTILRKVFMDQYIIEYFSSEHYNIQIGTKLSNIYDYMLYIDKLNIPFCNVGFIVKCSK